METKRYLKWVAIIAVSVIGLVYVASCILVAEKLTDVMAIVLGRPLQWLVGRIPRVGPTICAASPWIGGAFEFVVFLLLFDTPAVIAYRFLIRPIRNFELVDAQSIHDLESTNVLTREEAAESILSAMLATPDPIGDDAFHSKIEAVLGKSVGKADFALAELARRQEIASSKAVEIATMAGLTLAASSSAIGDGLGMFFWKSKLVYETFRIYGFRPDARMTVSIWAHVVFASLFAASIEELCELFDVSELVGGIGTRAIQGTVGAAVILKGGQLTRAYLTEGISAESRHHALSEFKSSDLTSVASSVGESLTKIGLKGFSA